MVDGANESRAMIASGGVSSLAATFGLQSETRSIRGRELRGGAAYRLPTEPGYKESRRNGSL